jgi:hypothetical protein
MTARPPMTGWLSTRAETHRQGTVVQRTRRVLETPTAQVLGVGPGRPAGVGSVEPEAFGFSLQESRFRIVPSFGTLRAGLETSP